MALRAGKNGMAKACGIVWLIVAWANIAWSGQPVEDWSTYTIRGRAQGTTYQISYYASELVIRQPSIDSIVAVIDSSMSLYQPQSLISRFNDSTTVSVVLDPHFKAVIEKSFEIHRHSGGVFDITVAPLVQLWGFGPVPQEGLPDSAAVAKALSCVGMDKLEFHGDTLSKADPCVRIDLNGIAQGYTVDVIAAFLESQGVGYYLVELGGELRVRGPKPDGSPLRIGIERPPAHGTGNELVQGVIALNEGSVTTAGNYRKFIEEDGNTLSHHIDPKTGYPFQTGIISATLYASDAITADGYDNVIIAMDADEAIAFVDGMPGMEVFLIYRTENGTTAERMSSGFSQLLDETRN